MTTPRPQTYSTQTNSPPFHDPFAGGGALPLEAQRLGLEAYASDLNPVAVTINKAMIEIPPRFAGRAPVGPPPRGDGAPDLGLRREWPGATGLAEDVLRYGTWMREEARKRIGHLYPPIRVTPEMAIGRPDLSPYVGESLTVIAWLWARTVKSPNPAFAHLDVPLASTFILSKKEGKEAYVEPVVEGEKYCFTIKVGKPTQEAEFGTKASRGYFRCLYSDTPIKYEYIDEEANARRMGARLMSIVAEGTRGRVYLPPIDEHLLISNQAKPCWKPETPCRGIFASNAQGRIYGFRVFGDYFTPRQLVALTTFSDLVAEVTTKAKADSMATGMNDDGLGLDEGGRGARAYGEAVGVLTTFALCRSADRGSTICSWDNSPKMEGLRNTFARQGISMTWDFSEGNPFSEPSGNWINNVEWVNKVIAILPARSHGCAWQADAQSQHSSYHKVISTDPPYYNNIAYADLSDFFFVWLRRTMKPIFPGLYATLAVPKAEELVASPYRHGGPQQAEAFFLDGMTRALHNLAEQAHPAFPVTIHYAFKQSETKGAEGTSSTGWETFLDAVLKAGFVINGTWPMRTELGNRMIGSGTNVLASSIVLVCRRRPEDAPTASRREFIRELNAVLPEALDEMTRGTSEGPSPVAPVDLSQAIIGPGMAIFSRYQAVLEADGSPMSVRTALQLINRFLAEDDFDPDTQFCLHWFEQYGWRTGPFGQADVMARAKGTSVDGLVKAGVVESSGGSLRLFPAAEYPTDWNPATDTRLPIWDALHHLIRTHAQEGEGAAGSLLAALAGKAEAVRQLAYRLYTLCERQGWTEDARTYNGLVTGWSAIEGATQRLQPTQPALFV